MFTHNLADKLTLSALDASQGVLRLKIAKKRLHEKFAGVFPRHGSLLPYEFVSAKAIQIALAEVAAKHLSQELHAPVAALLNRLPPAASLQNKTNRKYHHKYFKFHRHFGARCYVA